MVLGSTAAGSERLKLLNNRPFICDGYFSPRQAICSVVSPPVCCVAQEQKQNKKSGQPVLSAAFPRNIKQTKKLVVLSRTDKEYRSMHGCKTVNPSLQARIPFGEIPLRLLVFVFLCRSIQRKHVCAFKEKTRDENLQLGLVVSRTKE